MSTHQIPPTWSPPVKVSVEERTKELEAMRTKCPIAFLGNAANKGRAWSVFRWADISQIVRDFATFSNGKRVRLASRRVPLESDPPEHTQIRKLLMPFFSPKYMRQFEAETLSIANDIVGTFIQSGGGDFAHQVARILPTQVLLRRLGQPKEDWKEIKDWSEATMPREKFDADQQRRFSEADAALWAYSRDVVADRKDHPRDADSDIVSALLAGSLDGTPIDEELVVGSVRLMIAAGHDSTSQALGICAHYLATHPELQAQLRSEPTLIPKAIEEILRLESPVVAMPRIVSENVVLHDAELKAGDRVMLNWASANRDPQVYDDPDQFRLDRGPTKHMVFGDGVHTCLGAPMARQEIRISLEMMLSSTTDFSLSGPIEYMDMVHYGFESLPLCLINN
jgi:cytochrome P450